MSPEMSLPIHVFSSFLPSGAHASFVYSERGYNKGLFVQSIARLAYYGPKHSSIEPEQNGTSQTRELEEEVQFTRDMRNGKM